MDIEKTTKIRIKLEAFNHEILSLSCQKILETLNNSSMNSISVVTIPTKKRIYCVLRSPHVDKDSREHFEIRRHKRILDVHYDSKIALLDLLSSIDLAPGISYRICLF